jgi:hypothetical protein
VTFARVKRLLHRLSAFGAQREVSETKLPDEHRGFQGYLPVHLRPTSYAVRKHDRDLDDVETSQVAKVVNLHLEAVAVSLRIAEIYSLKDPSTEALKAAGAIPDR